MPTRARARLAEDVTSQTHGDGTLQPPPGARMVEPRTLTEDARVCIVASRYHSHVVQRMLDGAVAVCVARGIEAGRIDVVPAPGAFELPLLARAAAESGLYTAVVALGCVIRGETPHFDFVAAGAADGILRAALDTGVPVALGVLTVDDADQAWARAGGEHGDKGAEAAMSALAAAEALAGMRAAP